MKNLLEHAERPKEAKSFGLKAADAVWIATAILHSRTPGEAGFSPAAIRDEVISNHLTDVDEKTIYQHAVQHLVATKPKDPNSKRMLTDVGNGQRRLFVPGDPSHPSKQNGQSLPKLQDLPASLLPWLKWYENWSRSQPSKQPSTSAADPMEALEGTWTFGDGDSYLREMREGWESRR